jgi:hypothetical protein
MKNSLVTFGALILGILCAIIAAQESNSVQELGPLPAQHRPGTDDEANSLLERALHFADLYNWHASGSYFTQAQGLLRPLATKGTRFMRISGPSDPE